MDAITPAGEHINVSLPDCEDKHRSIGRMLGTILTLMGILVVVGGAVFKMSFESVAKTEAIEQSIRQTENDLNLFEKISDSEHKRLAREIELTKTEATERLANAIESIGYKRDKMQSDIMNELGRIKDDVGRIKGVTQ